jgi:hypothetical protein
MCFLEKLFLSVDIYILIVSTGIPYIVRCKDVFNLMCNVNLK